MSLPTALTPAILDTAIGHLAPHFLTSTEGDLPTARHAASRMLAAHDVVNEEELHLATEIVSFGLHALEALSEAAEPDLSLNRKLRLRGSAVSLSREAHKAQRKLDQLKAARLTATPDAPAVTSPEPTLQPRATTDALVSAPPAGPTRHPAASATAGSPISASSSHPGSAASRIAAALSLQRAERTQPRYGVTGPGIGGPSRYHRPDRPQDGTAPVFRRPALAYPLKRLLG